jgi:hypothetical protein
VVLVRQEEVLLQVVVDQQDPVLRLVLLGLLILAAAVGVRLTLMITLMDSQAATVVPVSSSSHTHHKTPSNSNK